MNNGTNHSHLATASVVEKWHNIWMIVWEYYPLVAPRGLREDTVPHCKHQH